MSLRQFEALAQSDIIACEDTRKTGKMLQLIQDKRLKEKFKSEFGLSVDDFVMANEVNAKNKDFGADSNEESETYSEVKE